MPWSSELTMSSCHARMPAPSGSYPSCCIEPALTITVACRYNAQNIKLVSARVKVDIGLIFRGHGFSKDTVITLYQEDSNVRTN